jgi:hypothetical protein
MANLLNRSNFGNLSCAWGVFQARFTNAGDTFTLTDLKHNSTKPVNPVDLCAGAQQLPASIRKRVGRDYYCPYEESRLAPSVCQWVKSSDPDKGADTQKSKSAGQTAIVLQILGLAKAEYFAGGRMKHLVWTDTAQEASQLDWGSADLQEFLFNTLRGYGPLVSLVHTISKVRTDSFTNKEVEQILRFRSTNEPISVTCCSIEYGPFVDWDSSSNDALSRSSTVMLGLASSIGIITPAILPAGSLDAALYSDLLLQYRLANPEGKMSYPKSWTINRGAIQDFFDGHRLTLPLTYNFFTPLSTAREANQKCPNCGSNLIRAAKDRGRKLLTNRRLLLIRALEIAKSMGGKVDLQKLAQYSLSYPGFFIESSYQERSLCTVTPEIISLFGAINRVDAQFCYPLSEFKLKQFDPGFEYIDAIITTMDEICSMPGVVG